MTPNPLNGPFMSAVDLTRYDDDPSYPILLPDSPSGMTAAARVLDRLDRAATGKAA